MRCPRCQQPQSAQAAFCPACGSPLRGRTEPAPESAAGEVGERRTATAVFSDLSGYTALNENLDPEDVANVMAEIKDGASRIVEAHGGMVNQFVGDQVMALFGVPMTHDDDPIRAVLAALALHEFMRDFGIRFEARLGRRLAFHTGVNSGLIVTQQRDRREGVFTITGDAINTGARLASAAGPDEVLIGPEVFRAVAPYFDTDPVGKIELRGKAAPVETRRVRGVIALDRFEAARLRGLSAMVGRDVELGQFRGCLHRAAEGGGSLLCISGEAGVGKSRLFHEFQRISDEAGWHVLRARCEAFGSVPPYAPFTDLLRDALGIPLADEDAATRVIRRLRDLGTEEHHLPVVLQLLSLSHPNYPLPRDLHGETLRDAIHEALAALIERQARRETTVILLEDWHGADPSSEQALRHFLQRLPGCPLVLAINYRPHFQPDWSLDDWNSDRGAGASRLELELEPLGARDSRHLISELFPHGRLPERWLARISSRTGGNPLFIEEVCRGIFESGVLQPAGSDPDSLAESVWVPTSVEAVIRERIDRLATDTIRVLRAASVLGSEFRSDILDTLTDGVALPEALAELEGAGLIRRSAPPVWRFKHDITRSVAYESLLRSDRRQLHERAGRAIETRFPGERIEARLEELAHHFQRSSNTEKALEYLERAGNKATVSFALEQAREHYGAALKLLGGLETTPERTEKRFELTFRWSQAGWYAPTPEQIDALEDARSLAHRLGDPARELRCIYFIGWLQHGSGAAARAVDCFERCIAMAPPNDPRLLAQLYCNLGENLAIASDYPRALESLEKGLALRKDAFKERWPTNGMAYALSWLGLVHADRGDFSRFDGVIEEALSIIDPQVRGSTWVSINQVRSVVESLRGDWETCLRHAAHGQRVSGAIGAHSTVGMALCVEGYARFHAHGDPLGITTLESGIARMEAEGSQLVISLYLAYWAEVLARSGAAERATEVALRAIARAEQGDCLGLVAAHRALALARSCASPADLPAARAAADEASRLAAKKESPREIALTELLLAEVLGNAGQRENARQLAASAGRRLSSMGMAWHAERALVFRETLAP